MGTQTNFIDEQTIALKHKEVNNLDKYEPDAVDIYEPDESDIYEPDEEEYEIPYEESYEESSFPKLEYIGHLEYLDACHTKAINLLWEIEHSIIGLIGKSSFDEIMRLLYLQKFSIELEISSERAND